MYAGGEGVKRSYGDVCRVGQKELQVHVYYEAGGATFMYVGGRGEPARRPCMSEGGETDELMDGGEREVPILNKASDLDCMLSYFRIFCKCITQCTCVM